MRASQDSSLFILFAKVAEMKSISAAARALAMQKGTVSRAISKLEAALGNKLLVRRARDVGLTEAGQVLLPYCQRMSMDLQEAQAAISSVNGSVRGRLRISAPITFGRLLLSPVLPQFLAQNPEVRLELELTNRRVDPIEEGFDLVIRMKQQMDGDPRLVATELLVMRYALCASPRYLREHGIPRTPSELASHPVIDFFEGKDSKTWHFLRKGAKQSVKVRPRADTSDPVVRRDAAAAGLGVALLPHMLIESHIRDRRLQIILSDWQLEDPIPIFALYPADRVLTPKSRAFLSFLTTAITSERKSRKSVSA